MSPLLAGAAQTSKFGNRSGEFCVCELIASYAWQISAIHTRLITKPVTTSFNLRATRRLSLTAAAACVSIGKARRPSLSLRVLLSLFRYRVRRVWVVTA